MGGKVALLVLLAGCIVQGADGPPILAPEDAPGSVYMTPRPSEWFPYDENPVRLTTLEGAVQEAWLARLEDPNLMGVSYKLSTRDEALRMALEEVDCAYADGVLVKTWFVRITGEQADAQAAATRMAARVGGERYCDTDRGDGDGPHMAQQLVAGTNGPFSMSDQGDEDWYTISVAQRSWIAISFPDNRHDAFAVASLPPQGRDADRFMDREGGFDGVTSKQLPFSVLSDNGVFDYRIEVRIEPLAHDRTDTDNSPQDATLLESSTGTIDPRFEEDWYHVPAGSWRIELESEARVEMDERDAGMKRISPTERYHGEGISPGGLSMDVVGPTYVRVGSWDQVEIAEYSIRAEQR